MIIRGDNSLMVELCWRCLVILLRGGSPLQKVRNEVADVLKVRSLWGTVAIHLLASVWLSLISLPVHYHHF
jgi:hypothetical protein